MNELHASSDRSAESYAVVGAEYIVVHCLRDGDDLDAFAMQPLTIAEGVITADRHKDLDSQIFEDSQHVRREVPRARVRFFGPGMLRVAQKVRFIFELHFE